MIAADGTGPGREVGRSGGRGGPLERLRRRHPGSSVGKILFYDACRIVSLVGMMLLCRMRWYGARHVPQEGALLIVANHQSFLDPPLVGHGVGRRQIDYVARSGLFRFRPFGWLIGALNAVPLKEGGDAAAMKEALRRLEMGRAVLIFPEGSRSEDGTVGEFKRGAAVLVKRAACPVIPVALEGCFDAWPRRRRLPRVPGVRIAARFGRPIPHAELMEGGPEEALRRLEREIESMRLELRSRLRRQSGGLYPAPGPADGWSPEIRPDA